MKNSIQILSVLVFITACGRDPMGDFTPTVTTTESGTGGMGDIVETGGTVGAATGTQGAGGKTGVTASSTQTGGSIGAGGNTGFGGTTAITTVTGGSIGSSDLEFHLDASNRGQVVTAGDVAVQSARYKVLNTSDAKRLTTLTLVNDLDGVFDAPQDSPAIKQVWMGCSSSGQFARIYTAMIGGKATFSGLNCWDETGNGLEVEIGFDVNTFESIGSSISGMKIRLGILENSVRVFGQKDIGHITIRRSFPDFKFAVTNRSTSELADGTNRLYGLNVAAIGGDVGLARLTFKVVNNPEIGNFKLYRGGTLITNVKMYYFGITLIVSFGNEEKIPDGTIQTYHLDADIANAKKGDKVSVNLVISTTSEFSVSNPCGPNTNTARIYSTDGSSIFTNSAGLSSEVVGGAETVWSDLSADAHMYPTVTNGQVTAASGSCDWINGWGLGAEELEANILTYK